MGYAFNKILTEPATDFFAFEGIYQVFKLQNSPAKALRNLGLFAADKSKAVKAQVIKFAAGLS